MAKIRVSKRIYLNKDAVEEKVEIPSLLDLQVKSFENFVKNGIKEEFSRISPIVGYGGKYELYFLDDYHLMEPEVSLLECKNQERTYSASLKVPVRLVNTETGEVQEQEVFLGDLPLMTDRGTFLINGAERVIVSQFVRSPGVYFRKKISQTVRNKESLLGTIIPNRGAWLEIERESSGLYFVYINKMKRVSLTIFLGALGYTAADINKKLPFLADTLQKFPIESEKESLLAVYRVLNSGEPITYEGAKEVLTRYFFDIERYDLSQVGRYKINTRLGLSVHEEIVVLSKEDIEKIVIYLDGLAQGKGRIDDIDHLGNRRIRAVGEQLQRQFRVGLVRLQRLIAEQMALKSSEKILPQQLINIRPLVAVLREFFGSSQLSQFMDQTNPLAEIVHKRRLSALGPGGLTKERAGFEVRDIHPTHYGRICPIETPEGPNAGLIGPLAAYGQVNKHGFIETPYLKVEKGVITNSVVYLTADEEEGFYITPWDTKLDGNKLAGSQIVARHNRQFGFVSPDEVNLIGVSPRQLVGVACGLIPFLEHDDANRALMGANMQRQAVPLVFPEAPYVGTGMEQVVARDSGVLVKSTVDGVVDFVASNQIVIKSGSKKITFLLEKYQRSNQNTARNQKPIVRIGDKVKVGDVIADGASTQQGELALGRNVLVGFMPWEGYNFEDAVVVSERLVKDDVFTSIHIYRYEIDVRSTKLGPEELTREIPNISEESLRFLNSQGIVTVGAVVKPGDILVGKVTPKGETEPPAEEKLLRAIFGDKARDMRDTSMKVSSGESGKVIGVRVFSRENKDDLPPGVLSLVRVYIAQLRQLSIGDKIAGRHGNKGVISTILPIQDMPFLQDGTPLDIVLNPLGVPSRMNVGQLFEALLGMGAHVLGENYCVQLFDEALGENISNNDVENKLIEASKQKGFEWLNKTGAVTLYDGRTGEPFYRKVTVGWMYVLKLIHLVKDKIHARSTGPYSLVTQQPLGGKAQYGGQRFGEMEVWALEAYGAAHTLQEMLTIKSDDLTGRAKAYESIIKGAPLSRPGTPESFRVLLRELRSIGIDIRVVASGGQEIDTR